MATPALGPIRRLGPLWANPQGSLANLHFRLPLRWCCKVIRSRRVRLKFGSWIGLDFTIESFPVTRTQIRQAVSRDTHGKFVAQCELWTSELGSTTVPPTVNYSPRRFVLITAVSGRTGAGIRSSSPSPVLRTRVARPAAPERATGASGSTVRPSVLSSLPGRTGRVGRSPRGDRLGPSPLVGMAAPFFSTEWRRQPGHMHFATSKVHSK